MDAILFYGIIILLALGFLALAWFIVRGWLALIVDFLAGVLKLLWGIIKAAFWVVTLPFRLIGAIFRLFRKKSTASREQDVTSV
ncbi:hypothetical protein LOK74_20460 [Brevibacillus humidisoli]|uniref:hypothetical protein n=1 Tax=Brevibacillus humidisoli TaxID=2895522 RepID=UPI001E5274DF|nr:hypothetical protein [Brevibacillus humidisoli]UFJ40376.1 hypothetical protein LOK74_20460 [Brevibacillus humidisoli]